MIELIDISKTYNTAQGLVTALKNINLQIKPGTIFGIVGESGAGKSSLIRVMNLLERPTTGKVIVANQDLTQLSASELRKARQHIGMIFQHFNLISVSSVFDNVALPLRLLNVSKNQIEQRVSFLLQLVGLSDKRDVYPNQLSGGQKQRVAIARALATEPKVLLCDEATSALDPQMTQSVLQLLKTINQQLGITIALITHEMDVVKTICDEIALLEKGSIIEKSDVVEFFIRPQTETAKRYVSLCLRQQLMSQLQKRLSDQQKPSHSLPLLRLSFEGKIAAQPFISFLVRNYEMEINILQANIEEVREHTIGILVVEITKNEQRLSEALDFLKAKGVYAEVIGYVD